MPQVIYKNIVVNRFENKTSFELCAYAAIRFFEVLLIEKGQGLLNINGHKIPYCDNQLFILVPNDMYTFIVETPTTVSTVKFLNSLFINNSDNKDHSEIKDWFRKIETILHSANRTTTVELREGDDESIASLFTVICKEFNDNELRSDLVIKNTLHSMLHIIARNVSNSSVKSSSSKIQEMLNYLHYHIYDAELISNKALADKFNISENYIGEYFKKQMGISLKKYTLNYKLKLAETRLKYTDSTLSEIALQLGFTDSSHLDKTFLSYKGMTASAYRLKK